MLLVVADVGHDAGPQPLEEGLALGDQGVGGLEQSLGLGPHHRGEERALVGKVVVHQRARDPPGALGDLVDADLVVRTLAEHLGAQCEQFAAPVLRRQTAAGG